MPLRRPRPSLIQPPRIRKHPVPEVLLRMSSMKENKTGKLLVSETQLPKLSKNLLAKRHLREASNQLTIRRTKTTTDTITKSTSTSTTTTTTRHSRPAIGVHNVGTD